MLGRRHAEAFPSSRADRQDGQAPVERFIRPAFAKIDYPPKRIPASNLPISCWKDPFKPFEYTDLQLTRASRSVPSCL